MPLAQSTRSASTARYASGSAAEREDESRTGDRPRAKPSRGRNTWQVPVGEDNVQGASEQRGERL